MSNTNTNTGLIKAHTSMLPIITSAPVFVQLDKNGLPVHRSMLENTGDISKSDFILIKGVVRNPQKHCAEMVQMLEEGRVVTLQDGRGSAFEHMKDESVLFHALIPKQATSEYKEVLLKGKDWLKRAFAGWAHVYHEVFAAAQVIAIQAL